MKTTSALTMKTKPNSKVDCPRCCGTGEEPGAPVSLTDGKALCTACGGTGTSKSKAAKHHNGVVLLVSKEHWEVLRETLRMDSQSSAFDPQLRRQIAKAYDGVSDITEDVSDLLDEVEMVPRAATINVGSSVARFIGEDRVASLTKHLRRFRSPFNVQGGRRIYKRKVI
jgi:hypothetical protein